MANFLLVYTGGSQPESPEAGEAVMAAWMGWFGQIGEAVVDGGNPTTMSVSIASDGTVSSGGASAVTGYSVLKADSLEAATELAKGCPHLAAGGAVEVYETIDASAGM